MRRAILAILLGAVGLLGPARPVAGQLISPGKLASAHAAYEGVSNCTSCHKLGQRGVDAGRCLDCHAPLKARIERRQGYHGRLDDTACGTCHKDHYGRDFAIVRFDTTRFDHAEAGYVLRGAHRATSCRSCHKASLLADRAVIEFQARAGALDRTFLGLATICAGCHESDNPHGGQFGTAACADCHAESDWKPKPGFDHARTRYPLTGRHVGVACASCHKPQAAGVPIPFRGLGFGQCSSCHADPHAGRLGSACSSCHATRGWQPESADSFEATFDHSRTGFPLVGVHASAACASCHRAGASASVTVSLAFPRAGGTRTYPVPAHESCASCHADVHAGDLPRRGATGACTDCHGQEGWTPSRFDPFRHASETRFPLEGAHLAVPCADCHTEPARQGSHAFARADLECASCHAGDDPHGGQFRVDGMPTACSACHTVDAWTLPGFDHSATRFALDGRHATIPCGACHKADDPTAPVPWRGLSTACASCHTDVHRAQFEPRTCDSCHDTSAFHLASFNHGTTRFPLDGAHATVACAACHATETAPDGTPFVRFRPLDTRCAACHRS